MTLGDGGVVTCTAFNVDDGATVHGITGPGTVPAIFNGFQAPPFNAVCQSDTLLNFGLDVFMEVKNGDELVMSIADKQLPVKIYYQKHYEGVTPNSGWVTSVEWEIKKMFSCELHEVDNNEYNDCGLTYKRYWFSFTAQPAVGGKGSSSNISRTSNSISATGGITSTTTVTYIKSYTKTT